MTRIQREVATSLAGKTRISHAQSAQASDFSMLLLPGADETSVLVCNGLRSGASAKGAPPEEVPAPGQPPVSVPFDCLQPAGALWPTNTRDITSTAPCATALPSSQPHHDVTAPWPQGLARMTEEGRSEFAAELRPRLLAPSVADGDFARSTVEAMPTGPFDSVLKRTLEKSVQSDRGVREAESKSAREESLPTVPKFGSALLYHAELPRISNWDCEQATAIQELPLPIRGWSGDGDRLFDLTAWARGLLSYLSLRGSSQTPAWAVEAPSLDTVASAEVRPAWHAARAMQPVDKQAETNQIALRQSSLQIGGRDAVEDAAEPVNRDARDAPEAAEIAPPRQVLLVVREDSAVLYVRDYFAQAAGLEVLVEQVRKLLLTRNRAGLRVVINGQWQTTEQIRRGNDGN